MNEHKSILWEHTIQELLGDDNPCDICLVKVTCGKSFTKHTACEQLAQKLEAAIDKIKKGSLENKKQ